MRKLAQGHRHVKNVSLPYIEARYQHSRVICSHVVSPYSCFVSLQSLKVLLCHFVSLSLSDHFTSMYGLFLVAVVVLCLCTLCRPGQ